MFLINTEMCMSWLLLILVTVGFTSLVKEPGPEYDYVPPYRAKVKNKSFCTFAPTLCFRGMYTNSFTLYICFIRNVDLREARISGLYVEFMKLVSVLIKKITIQINSP